MQKARKIKLILTRQPTMEGAGVHRKTPSWWIPRKSWPQPSWSTRRATL